jgi:hypothetical protein
VHRATCSGCSDPCRCCVGKRKRRAQRGRHKARQLPFDLQPLEMRPGGRGEREGRRTLSDGMSHRLGGARPVSLSLMPIFSLTRFWMSTMSASTFLSCRA